MRKTTGDGGLVYSTDSGRMCPACRKPLAGCVCAALAKPARQGDGIVRVSRETAGRGGKTVTVIRGLDLDDAAMASLGKRLKAACGTGGTVKDAVVELQGDHCDAVMRHLGKEGFAMVKRTGG
jgi:translation initiation factor 1